jgi:hypothetical protein
VVGDVFVDQAIQRIKVRGCDGTDNRPMGLPQFPLPHPALAVSFAAAH